MVLLPDGEKMSKIYLFIQACRPHRAATVLCYRFIEHILSESLSIVYYNHFHFWTTEIEKLNLDHLKRQATTSNDLMI